MLIRGLRPHSVCECNCSPSVPGVPSNSRRTRPELVAWSWEAASSVSIALQSVIMRHALYVFT